MRSGRLLMIIPTYVWRQKCKKTLYNENVCIFFSFYNMSITANSQKNLFQIKVTAILIQRKVTQKVNYF